MAWYDGGLILVSLINIAVVTIVVIFTCIVHKKEKFRRHFRKRIYNKLPGTAPQEADPLPTDKWFKLSFMKKEELLNKCGGDATVLLLTNRYLFYFFCCCIPFAGGLIVIHATDSYAYQYYLAHPPAAADFEWMNGIHQWSVINITPKSNRLIVHLVVSILFDIGIWYLVWKVFRLYVFCANSGTNSSSPAMIRTAMVYGSSSDHLSSPQDWLEKYVPEDTNVVAIHIPHKEPRKFSKLIRKYEQIMQNIDDVVFYNNQLADKHEHAQMGGVASSPDTEEKPPPRLRKVVVKKCRKMDEMEHWKAELVKTQVALRPNIEQFHCNRAAGVVFVTFDTPRDCIKFLTYLQKKKSIINGRFAPHPNEVHFEALHHGITGFGLDFLMLCLFIVLLFTWAIPVAWLGNLDNFRNVKGPVGDAFNGILGWNPQITALLTGYSPVIVMAIFNVLIMLIIKKMVEFQKPHTDSTFHAMCFRKLFAFKLCAYVFFQAVFASGLLGIPELLEGWISDEALQLVAEIVSPVLPLFITVLINGAGIASIVWFLQPIPLIKGLLLSRKYPPDDTRRLNKVWTAKPFKFWKEWSVLLFGASVSLIFALTVPILCLLGVPFMLSRYFVAQYLLTEFYPYTPTSGLRMVHSILHSILIMNVIRQMGMLGVFVARERSVLAYIYIPFVVLSVVVHVATWWLVRKTRQPLKTECPPHMKPYQLDVSATDVNIVDILTGYQHPREGFTLDDSNTEPVPFQMMFPQTEGTQATPDPHLYATQPIRHPNDIEAHPPVLEATSELHAAPQNTQITYDGQPYDYGVARPGISDRSEAYLLSDVQLQYPYAGNRPLPRSSYV